MSDEGETAGAAPWADRGSAAVRLLLAGGAITMRGTGGKLTAPEVGADEIVAMLPGEAPSIVPEVYSEEPSAYFTGADVLGLARRVREVARSGQPVVVACGTDLLEEIAIVCDLLHDAPTPVIVTGAAKPVDAPGADGPGNLYDAISACLEGSFVGLGTIVCFDGKLHAAARVRQVDSVSVDAFDSPCGGPVGAIAHGRVRLMARVNRPAAIDPVTLDRPVGVLTLGLGSEPAWIRCVAAGLHGLVLELPGAGHVSPLVLELVREIPVVACVRPQRGSILHGTYGFAGAASGIRESGVTCAAALSAGQARVKLMCCLGAGCDRDEISRMFAPDDW